MNYDISKDLPYSIKAPEDALQHLEMMERIIMPICNKTQDLHYDFLFKVGNITCSSKNKKEFICEIFGQTDFVLNHIHIYVFSPNKEKTFTNVSLHNFNTACQLSLSSYSKDILIKLDRLYNIQIEKAAKPSGETVTIDTYIDQSHHVSINGNINNAAIGDNNTVINSSSTDSHNAAIPASEKKSFWKSVFESLTANFIWWLIGLICSFIVLVIIAYLKSK